MLRAHPEITINDDNWHDLPECANRPQLDGVRVQSRGMMQGFRIRFRERGGLWGPSVDVPLGLPQNVPGPLHGVWGQVQRTAAVATYIQVIEYEVS